MTAHIPDQQWDLILQSLRASGNNETELSNVPAAVVVEAGVLVRVWRFLQRVSDIVLIRNVDSEFSQWQIIIAGLHAVQWQLMLLYAADFSGVLPLRWRMNTAMGNSSTIDLAVHDLCQRSVSVFVVANGC